MKKKIFDFGTHFSEHVHGMFLYPKPTIRKIATETISTKDLLVPILTVICAGVLTALGSSIWKIMVETSVLMSFIYVLGFFAKLVALPIWYLFIWLVWVGIFHFIGSFVSGKDITNLDIIHRTLKLVGLSMVPLFLNILPLFRHFTWFWVTILCYWSMQANYRISKKGGFLVVLPMLFVTVVGTLTKLGLS